RKGEDTRAAALGGGAAPAVAGGGGRMPDIGVLSLIVANEALTRGLADPEARMLIQWLVERAERLAAAAPPPEVLEAEVTRLCRRARAVARFVSLWCYER